MINDFLDFSRLYVMQYSWSSIQPYSDTIVIFALWRLIFGTTLKPSTLRSDKIHPYCRVLPLLHHLSAHSTHRIVFWIVIESFTKMSGKSNNSLQILVDCFDDIPNIMTKMNESINNSPTRYKGKKVDALLHQIFVCGYILTSASLVHCSTLQPLVGTLRLRSMG